MRGDDVVCNIGPLSGRTYHKKIEPLLPQTKVACLRYVRGFIHNCAVIHQTAGRGAGRGDAMTSFRKFFRYLMGTGQHGAQVLERVGLDVVSGGGSRISSFVCLCVNLRGLPRLQMEGILPPYPSPCRVHDRRRLRSVAKAPAMDNGTNSFGRNASRHRVLSAGIGDNSVSSVLEGDPRNRR